MQSWCLYEKLKNTAILDGIARRTFGWSAWSLHDSAAQIDPKSLNVTPLSKKKLWLAIDSDIAWIALRWPKEKATNGEEKVGDGKGICFHIALNSSPFQMNHLRSSLPLARKQGIQVYNERELSEHSLPHMKYREVRTYSAKRHNQASVYALCCRFKASRNVCDKEVRLRL